MAYDYATHSTVIFGGFTNPSVLADTWTLQQTWTQRSPAKSPSPRYGVAMAWDGTGGNVVLFGGEASNGESLNDTWTWDGVNWTQQFPPVSPPSRSFDTQGMIYDATTQTVVMFGGFASNSLALNDTWTWDGSTKTWSEQFPLVIPAARQAPLAYDASTGTVVMFGGFGGTTTSGFQFDDTWIWNGANWIRRHPSTSPSPRTGASMAYDASLGAVVLFGGYAGSWPNSLNDTWTWNGINWTQITLATTPHNRYAFGIEYDPLSKGILMFGGFSSGPGLNDTWVLTVAP